MSFETFFPLYYKSFLKYGLETYSTPSQCKTYLTVGGRKFIKILEWINRQELGSDFSYISNQKISNVSIPNAEITFGKSKDNFIIAIDELHCMSVSDWHDFLDENIKNAKHILIISPIYGIGEASVNLTEYGENWYINNVPFKNPKSISKWFANHNSTNKYGLYIKQNYGYWQSGLSLSELICFMHKRGFIKREQFCFGAFKGRDRTLVAEKQEFFISN